MTREQLLKAFEIVKRFARMFDKDNWQDLAQDCMENLIKNNPIPDNLEAYLFTIVKRKFLDKQRSIKLWSAVCKNYDHDALALLAFQSPAQDDTIQIKEIISDITEEVVLDMLSVSVKGDRNKSLPMEKKKIKAIFHARQLIRDKYR